MPEQEPGKEYQFHSLEFQVLKKQFGEICNSYGLEAKESELIDSTLADFSGIEVGIFGKIEALSEKIEKDNPRRQDVLAAFTEISHSYLMKSPLSDFGKFAKQSPFN